ncbi:MAG: hypothetical protein KY442_11515 [Proteobacteria bacterium]|nr:hypothetical protein [Pseudomonadota bacterium]
MALEFDLNRDAPAAAQADCVIVGAFADNTLTPAASALDSASNGRIKALLQRGDVSGKSGKTTLLHDLAGVTAPRVLVVGLGDAGKFGPPQYLKAVADAARALKLGPVAHALFTLAEVPVTGRDGDWAIRHAAIGADHACYRYLATLGDKSKHDEPGLRRLSIAGDSNAEGSRAALASSTCTMPGSAPRRWISRAAAAGSCAGTRIEPLKQG